MIPNEQLKGHSRDLIHQAEALLEASKLLVQKAKLAANRIADLDKAQNPHHGPEVAAHAEAQERLTDALSRVNDVVSDVRIAYGHVRDHLPER